jgi:hypothetical protein
VINPVLPACVALGFGLSFAQSTKLGIRGFIPSAAGLLLLPGIAATLYLISKEMGWWTILVFIGSSLIVGTINAILIQKEGQSGLLRMQPMLSVGFLLSTVLCWVV